MNTILKNTYSKDSLLFNTNEQLGSAGGLTYGLSQDYSRLENFIREGDAKTFQADAIGKSYFKKFYNSAKEVYVLRTAFET